MFSLRRLGDGSPWCRRNVDARGAEWEIIMIYIQSNSFGKHGFFWWFMICDCMMFKAVEVNKLVFHRSWRGLAWASKEDWYRRFEAYNCSWARLRQADEIPNRFAAGKQHQAQSSLVLNWGSRCKLPWFEILNKGPKMIELCLPNRGSRASSGLLEGNILPGCS